MSGAGVCWIEVDEQVMASIRGRAEPFADSPNDVLRRAFDLKPHEQGPSCSQEVKPSIKPGAPKKSRRRRDLLPMGEYELPLLRAISGLGGSGPRWQIKEAVEECLADRLTDEDRSRLPSGSDTRFGNRLGFARLRAVERGLIKTGSPRGVWELSEAGFAQLERLEAIAAERSQGATG